MRKTCTVEALHIFICFRKDFHEDMAHTTITLFYSSDVSPIKKIVILSNQTRRSSSGNCVLLVTTETGASYIVRSSSTKPEDPFLESVWEDFPQEIIHFWFSDIEQKTQVV